MERPAIKGKSILVGIKYEIRKTLCLAKDKFLPKKDKAIVYNEVRFRYSEAPSERQRVTRMLRPALPMKNYNHRSEGRIQDFFAEEMPEYVFLAAAHVGGIVAKSRYPGARFIYETRMIQNNVIHASYQNNEKKHCSFCEVLVVIRQMLPNRCQRIACSLRHLEIYK